MLKDKRFWIGFALAYALALVVPPTRLISMGKKSGG